MGTELLTYAVWHHTTLRYKDPVGLSFNEVRMRPRDRGSQRTLAFSLLSNPSAVPRSRIDYFGNYVHRVDVTSQHDVLEFVVEAVVENSEPRRRRLPEWDEEVLAGDPRLEYVLPSPRVPLSEATKSLWREWNGEDRSFDALLATAERIPRELRYVTGATTVEFEHRRPPCRGRGCLPGLQPPVPGHGSRRGMAGAVRERVPRSGRRADVHRGAVACVG